MLWLMFRFSSHNYTNFYLSCFSVVTKHLKLIIFLSTYNVLSLLHVLVLRSFYRGPLQDIKFIISKYTKHQIVTTIKEKLVLSNTYVHNKTYIWYFYTFKHTLKYIISKWFWHIETCKTLFLETPIDKREISKEA